MSSTGKLFLAFFLISLAICTARPSEVAAGSTPPGSYWAPAAAPTVSYEIELVYDEETSRFEGTERVAFTNKNDYPVSQIALKWSWGPVAELELTGYSSTVRRLGAWRDEAFFALEPPLAPDQAFEGWVSFQLPGAPEDEDLIIFTDWYPRLWWGAETLDNYQVSITPPPGFEVLTSGKYVQADAVHRADGIRDFGLILARGYDVIEASAGQTQVRVLSRTDSQACAQLLLETAAACVSFYREWLGFYPHQTLTIIPGAEQPMGGYPVASAIVAVHGQARMVERPESFWRYITAHEIGHQYWMEYVLQAPRAKWLMIGLGVYADRAYMLSRGYGDEHERAMVQRYMDGLSEGVDTRMDLSAEEKSAVGFDYNNIVTHGKGFAFISSLACYLGQERFETIYRHCLQVYPGQQLTASAFLDTCEALSGEKLGWMFEQWLYSNRFLSFEAHVESQEEHNGDYLTRLSIERTGTMLMPVPVEVVFEDGTRQRHFTYRTLPVTSLELVSTAPLASMEIDPAGEMPVFAEALPLSVEELARSIRALQYMGGQSAEALRLVQMEAMEEVTNPVLWLKLGMILLEGQYLTESLQALQTGLECEESAPSSLGFVFLAWQGHLLDLLGERDEALKCYQQALGVIPPEAYIRHDQYGICIDEDWLEQRLATPFILDAR